MIEPQSTDTRSILNALSTVTAGQEQMQKDVDKLRASTHALLILGVYGIALGFIVYMVARKGS